MKRFYIFKDGMLQAGTATRERAVELIHQYQELERHPFLRTKFSIIEGKKGFIPYRSQRKPVKRERGTERFRSPMPRNFSSMARP